jgi:tripartite-type tricarboxylate transporter receptor subunit TctC
MAPNTLVVKNDLPVKNVGEWIAYAKANAGKMSYASQGNGSTTHLTMELLKSRTDTTVTHVPYRGAAPAVNDLAGGHVDTMFSDLGGILPLYLDRKVRIIAAAGLKRVPELPDVPTIDESGVKGFSSSTFYSLMAPPKTPAAIRDKLNKAIVAGMQKPDVHAKLKSTYVDTSKLDIHQMGDFIKGEAKQWQDVIRGRQDHGRAVRWADFLARWFEKLQPVPADAEVGLALVTSQAGNSSTAARRSGQTLHPASGVRSISRIAISST